MKKEHKIRASFEIVYQTKSNFADTSNAAAILFPRIFEKPQHHMINSVFV